jgi:hypothetical protein
MHNPADPVDGDRFVVGDPLMFDDNKAALRPVSKPIRKPRLVLVGAQPLDRPRGLHMQHRRARAHIVVMALKVVAQRHRTLLKVPCESFGLGRKLRVGPQSHDQVHDAGILGLLDLAGLRAVGVRADRHRGLLADSFARRQRLRGLANSPSDVGDALDEPLDINGKPARHRSVSEVAQRVHGCVHQRCGLLGGPSGIVCFFDEAFLRSLHGEQLGSEGIELLGEPLGVVDAGDQSSRRDLVDVRE